MSDSAATILALAPVLPVVTINDLSSVMPLGKALLDGGLPVLEVTLRTPEGFRPFVCSRTPCPMPSWEQGRC